ncbi:DUF1772 domain-containing protein [Nocardia kruczakiae]|uniref:DUF1772 domain-containing protein n=1 Tax=Nocardia kruczakiae TaxID=261477 RepID=UPI000AF7F982|nr:DUF1772 domain-containing protein [Nocardia kruczakiae]
MLSKSVRGAALRVAACATVLVILSFLVTRFGNVPINQQIKRWAVGTPPADYADILRRWELFHFTRTGCAVVAFILVIVAVVGFTSTDDDIRRGEPLRRSSCRPRRVTPHIERQR